MSEASRLHATDRTGFLVSHANPDRAKLALQTDARFLETATFLEQQRPLLNVGQFKEKEKACGVNFTPHGALFAPRLRPRLQPISMSMFDWMHCFLVAGIFQTEVTYLLKVLHAVDIQRDELCLTRNLSCTICTQD